MVKFTTEKFNIDGATVELTRVPVRIGRPITTHLSNGTTREEPGSPMEQALYEIRVDGQLIGLAVRPYGFGKQHFRIERLGDGYNTRVFPQSYTKDDEYLFDLATVAKKAAELRAKDTFGKGSLKALPTQDEWDTHQKREIARQEREAADVKERVRLDDLRRAEDARLAEELRTETLSGLQSIQERLSANLTNFEMNALVEALRHYSIEPRRFHR